jgi:hypothetical protein
VASGIVTSERRGGTRSYLVMSEQRMPAAAAIANIIMQGGHAVHIVPRVSHAELVAAAEAGEWERVSALRERREAAGHAATVRTTCTDISTQRARSVTQRALSVTQRARSVTQRAHSVTQ